jgi:rod shape-determining protein MreC
MFDSLGRHRIFLTAAVLLGAAALLLSSSLQRRTRYSVLDRLLFDLAVPIEKMVALPAQSARGVWDDYLGLVGVRRENRDLRRRLSELSEENRQFREALLAGERYRRMGTLRDKFHQPMLPATLIGVDSSSWFRTVLLDKGTRDGVRRGMAVVTPDGVVGHVVAVSSSASKVLLMIDRSSAVDVMIERSRARGIVQGLTSDRCELKYATRGEDVKPGDRLISSGMDSIFPKGLAVGRVASVDPARRGLFQRADVEPAVDFNKLEEVFVILELSPQQKLLQEQAQRLE